MSGKGSEFERQICKKLSIWLTGKEKPYQFWRVPLSGGLATIDEENCDLSGDIRALTKEGEFLTSIFSIELKTGYPKTNFHQHLKGIKNFSIEQFWKQTLCAAKKSNRNPMLIYRKKGMNIIIGITKDIDLKLNLQLRKLMISFCNDIPDIIFYDFDDFFDNVKPESLKKLNGVN
jgi:hypothetical protein